MTRSKKGFTIPEILTAVMLGTLIIGAVLGAWFFAYRMWRVERIRTVLRVDLEMGIERIKSEAGLSSATYISLYKPAGETTYKAVSFPAAKTVAGGFLDLDDDGNIEWDKSVIYHVYDPGAGLEFRRTVFTGNRTVLLDNDLRAQQLASVYTAGDGSGWAPVGGESYQTQTLFRNLVELEINPKAQEFDGYSPTVRVSDNVELGSILLEPGDHSFKFEVTGQNIDSSGYEMGIDNISISPSGCKREAEVLTVTDDQGGSDSRFYDSGFGWSDEKYLEYTSGAEADFITFSMYYDLWRESAFENAILLNTEIDESPDHGAYAKLSEISDFETSWRAEDGTGGEKTDFATPLTDITVRNVVTCGNIFAEGDLVRVRFDSHSADPITITSAYLNWRDESLPYNRVSPATNPESHIQLFFTGNHTPDVTIPANSSVYSNWAIYEIESGRTTNPDYLVTFHVADDPDSSGASYWPADSGINSYLAWGDLTTASSWPLPEDDQPGLPTEEHPCYSKPDIYVEACVDVWSSEGEIICGPYDTKMDSPEYNQIAWTGSNVLFKVRSSGSPEMEGAPDWGDISGSSVNPHSVSYAGSGRYVQFWADLSITPWWSCIDHPSVYVTPSEYIAGTRQCPTCSRDLYVPFESFTYPWIDDVAIDWPGEEKMCDIGGYFAQKPDYGIIKLSVDGEELIKGLEFKITVYEVFQGKSYESSMLAEIEPRNTGK